MSGPETTGRKQADTQFKPGQSGNPAGRPRGSRHKLGENFITALQADFEQHGEAVIATVRAEDPVAYMKVVASILPKEVKVTTAQELSDEQLDERIRALAGALDIEVRASGIAGGEKAQTRPH